MAGVRFGPNFLLKYLIVNVEFLVLETRHIYPIVDEKFMFLFKRVLLLFRGFGS